MALRDETLYSLRQIVDVLPVQRTYWTVYKWATKGVAVDSKEERVTLKTRKVGGVMHTSIEAYYRFIDEQNAGSDDRD